MLRRSSRPHTFTTLGLLGLVACSGAGGLDTGAEAGEDGSTPADDGNGAGSGGPTDGGASDGDDDGSSSSSDSGSGGSGSVPTVNYVPTFPGAPSSEVGKPLEGGEVCDDVPGATTDTVSEVTRCFYGEEQTMPVATIEQVLECVDDTQTIHLRLTFNPNFNDNTYGEGSSSGWPHRRGHWFRDLTGSDHAELKLIDGDGEVAMQFKLDYIEADASAPSGYASQCTDGGDGNLTVGAREHIVDCTTSLDENLNARGYGDYTTDSPLTDDNYSVNPDAPEWDYRMVFDVWIDAAAFGDAGFSGAFIEYVHASPAKGGEETIEVTSQECPPCVPAPDYVCEDYPPPPTDDECVNRPDDVCEGGTGLPPEDPPFCQLYPTDPDCILI